MKVTEEIEVMPFLELECPYCFNLVEIVDVPRLCADDWQTLYCPVCKEMIRITIEKVSNDNR